MSLVMGVQITCILVSFALLLYGIEYLSLSSQQLYLEVWRFEKFNLNLKIISLMQILLASISLFLPHPVIYVGLFITHLLICVRFRGTFNGGSDMMVFILLTGLLVALWGPDEKIQRLGLIYIAIHMLYSYFKAGLVKVIRAEWHNGKALPVFLRQSLFLNVRNLSNWLHARPLISRLLAWAALFFELSSLALIFLPSLALSYFLTAIIFHLVIFFSFGLNRFFWAWISGWPAVFYVLTLF